jgi:transcriptional regulator with XRE-family HTH domain
MIVMEIGKLIEARRKELGFSLEEVGNAVGVGKSTVKKWESGKIQNMRRDKIALIANKLNLDPSIFIHASNLPPFDIEDFKNALFAGVGKPQVEMKKSPSNDGLLPDEQAVLSIYRMTPPEKRLDFIRQLIALVPDEDQTELAAFVLEAIKTSK